MRKFIFFMTLILGLILSSGTYAVEKKYAASLYGGVWRPGGDLKDWDGSGIFGISFLKFITDNYGIMFDVTGYSSEFSSTSYYGKIDTTALEAMATVTYGKLFYIYIAGGVGYYVNNIEEKVYALSISNTSTGTAIGYVVKFGLRTDRDRSFLGVFAKYNTNHQDLYNYITGEYYKADFGGTSYGIELGLHF
ncbi:hypothetical protein [Persephonella sp.]